MHSTRLRTIKNKTTNRLHLEKANGTDEQNKTYCSKNNDFWEYGKPTRQGQRTDLEKTCTEIINGETNIQTLAKNNPTVFVKYYKGIQELIKTIHPIPPRDFKTEVHYIWGKPGTGKSKTAKMEADNTSEKTYYKPRGEWWDGYKQHENVIIDDFYGWIKYDELLKICDRYPYKVQVKFGYEEFTTKRIWITSNVPLEELYKFEGYTIEAIKRRCTTIRHM